MLSHYLTLTLRNLKANKGYFTINLLGLIIGITSFIMIVLWIKTETSYDKFHKNARNIFRIDYLLYEEGILEQHSASGSASIGKEIKNTFPEVEDYTRFYRTESLVRYKDKIFKERNILYAQSSFFDLFSFPLADGKADSNILAINHAVITTETARKYFGEENPVGKMINIDGGMDFEVTAIAKTIPGNSHFEFDILLSYENLIKSSKYWDNSWVNETVYSYILLSPEADAKALEAKLPQIPETFIGRSMKEAFFLLEYRLVKLTDIHLHSSVSNELEVNGSYRNVVSLGIIACLVLLIAFINYINLATSRSIERAHEVGIRKVSGALRRDLIYQLMTEAALLNVLALIISLTSVLLLLPFFKQVMQSPLQIDYLIVLLLFFFLLATGSLITGVFPAIYISRFAPGLVLKGKNPSGSKWISRLKNYLVVFQFTISVILIICTITIYRQVNFMRHHNLGFDIEGLLVLEGPRIISANSFESYMNGLESFKNEIGSLSGVGSISASSNVPGTEIKNSRVYGIPVEGRNTEKRIDIYLVDDHFFKTYGLTLLAGDNFSATIKEESNKIILNESALTYFGFDDAESTVGKILRGGSQEVYIKGIINDFNQQSLKELPTPIAFFNQPVNKYYTIKASMTGIEQLIPKLEKIWTAYYPGNPFNYFFLDDFYDEQYIADQRFSGLFLTSSLLAIIIACLGLSGLSAFSITRRTKEIGIRKANGAKVIQVMILLNSDFMKWVMIAVIIATPFSLFAVDKWLQNFAYRIELSWWIFALAGIISLGIAILTVSWHSWRAATRNPADVLRYE
ncbi:MAG TPA: ABC transporter permease [Bacteroidales bacterium]|nr:ABC transporter permease [Bacteroidales bacterium]